MFSVTLKDAQFSKLSTFIETEVGINMPPTKRVLLESRLRKRLRILGLDNFDDYISYVFSRQGEEVVHMIDVVTTNKTDFYREPDHFHVLKDRILPERFHRDGWGERVPLKVWSAASSTGEEPYTLAIVLTEFKREHPRFDFRVLGTDIATNVLAIAERGVYAESRIESIESPLRHRYFLKSRDRSSSLVRLKPEIRRRVLFRRLNLMASRFPISDRFHVIFCRNVIIYFNRQRQEDLLRKLYNFLVPGGYLFVGHSEALAGIDLPIESVAPTVYRRSE